MKSKAVAVTSIFLSFQLANAQPSKSIDRSDKSSTAPTLQKRIENRLPVFDLIRAKPRDHVASPNREVRHRSIVQRGQERGGGNAVGNELFDFAEEGERFDIQSLPIYPKLLSVLETLKATSPQLWLDLTIAVEKSKWTFDPHPLAEQYCINASLSGLSREVVACQNELEIRIYQPWFTSAQVLDRSKVGLLIHEAVRRIGYVDPFVTQVTRDIMSLAEGRLSQGDFITSVSSYAGYGRGSILSKDKFCGLVDEAHTIVQNFSRTRRMDFGAIAITAGDTSFATRLFNIARADLGMHAEEKTIRGISEIQRIAELYGCL